MQDDPNQAPVTNDQNPAEPATPTSGEPEVGTDQTGTQMPPGPTTGEQPSTGQTPPGGQTV